MAVSKVVHPVAKGLVELMRTLCDVMGKKASELGDVVLSIYEEACTAKLKCSHEPRVTLIDDQYFSENGSALKDVMRAVGAQVRKIHADDMPMSAQLAARLKAAKEEESQQARTDAEKKDVDRAEAIGVPVSRLRLRRSLCEKGIYTMNDGGSIAVVPGIQVTGALGEGQPTIAGEIVEILAEQEQARIQPSGPGGGSLMPDHHYSNLEGRSLAGDLGGDCVSRATRL